MPVCTRYGTGAAPASHCMGQPVHGGKGRCTAAIQLPSGKHRVFRKASYPPGTNRRTGGGKFGGEKGKGIEKAALLQKEKSRFPIPYLRSDCFGAVQEGDLPVHGQGKACIRAVLPGGLC